MEGEEGEEGETMWPDGGGRKVLKEDMLHKGACSVTIGIYSLRSRKTSWIILGHL